MDPRPHDREEQPLERGDRVRIVRHIGWRDAASGKRVRLLGEYAYVSDASRAMTVGIKLEEYPEITSNVQGHEISLAPGLHEPEVEEPQVAQSSADVELVERVPAWGRPQYSVWRIGQDEGTATLLHTRGRWELDFLDLGITDVDGGEVGEYDDSAQGAWVAWNKMRSLMGPER